MLKSVALALCITVGAFAAHLEGTWKLNTAKSRYTGTPMPKDMTVTYTPQGSGWRYEAKGTSATGEPINASFVYAKDGEEIKVTGFPNWDAMKLTGGSADKSTATFIRQGKVVGSGRRTISSDGKTMTIRGNVTLPDGKKATYVSVYEKQ